MSLSVHNQIRQNAQDIRDYLSDLASWTSAKSEEKPKPPPVIEQMPIRGCIKQPKEQPSLKRDKTSIPEFYQNWEKFDAVSSTGCRNQANRKRDPRTPEDEAFRPSAENPEVRTR